MIKTNIYMYRCTNSFVVKYSLNNIGLHLQNLRRLVISVVNWLGS